MKRLPGILLFIIAAIFFVAAFANSQEGGIKARVSSSAAVSDNVISDKEEGDNLNLSFEEKHQDKDYIILLKENEVNLKKDYTYTTRFHLIIKILQEGGKSMGELPLPYNREKENLIKIEAVAVTPDGKKQSFTHEQDFALYEDQIYSDARVKILTMPGVNIGTIIELKVLKETKGQVIPNSYWDWFYLEDDNPTKRFKAKYVFPKSAGIRYKGFNVTYKPEIEENKKTITYKWNLEDVYKEPKDKDFQALPTIENIKNVVEFSSLKSWKEVSDWMFEAVNKNLKITPEIEEVAKQIFEGKKSVKEKVRAAIEYLRDNVRYVSTSFGDNTYEPHPTDEVFENKYADCKDISLLLMAMLKTAGIDSNLVLTNDETEITDPRHDLPMLDPFNHANVFVDDPEGDKYYVDVLLTGYDLGEFWNSYQGAYTFIITADGGRFDRFPIFDEKKAYSVENTAIAIKEDGSAIVELEIVKNLDASDDFKQEYKLKNDKEKEAFIQTHIGKIVSGGELITQEINGLEDRYGKIRTHIKMKKEDAYPTTSDLIIIDVKGFERKKHFTQKERKDPIFERVNSFQEKTIKYKFPENFQVLHLPENLELDTGIFKFTRSYSLKGNEITIKEASRKKRMTLGANKYPQVKKFYDELPAKSYQRIVLQRPKVLQ